LAAIWLAFDRSLRFNTDGPYRIIRKSDGLYVVGQGTLCAVETREEGEKLIERLTKGALPQH
jgi:hypothetical protein